MAKKDPTKIKVFHTSPDPTPPHVLAKQNEKYLNSPVYAKNSGDTLKQTSWVGKNRGFHAGTLNAALDRSLMMQTIRENDFYNNPDNEDDSHGPDFTTYLHTYEINKRPSMLTYEDPHPIGYDDLSSSIPKDYVEDLQVNEHSKKSINKYRNRWEDPGSISYVIPHQLVNTGHVKYLSTQQFSTDPAAEERDEGGYHAEAKKALGLE